MECPLALGLAVLILGIQTAQAGLPGVVTPENLKSTLAKLATARGEVIYSTFTMKHNNMSMPMMKNFGYWLNRHGLLPHTMLLARDERSFNIMVAEGLPVYWDKAWPLPKTLIDREFEQSKHWWGLQILSHGYKALFLDNDNVVLQNPLPTFDADYDVQGLSDWHEPELPATGEIAGREGGLGYKWVPWLHSEYGGQLAADWLMYPEQRNCALPFPNPAQSTGVLFLKPTSTTIRFMDALYRRVSDVAPHQWEQVSFNELIMSFLVGFGDDPPIRYRVLPVSQFSNIEVYAARIRDNLTVDQIILHAGYVSGAENKEREYTRLNLFHPDFQLSEANLNLTAPRSPELQPLPPPPAHPAMACNCPPAPPTLCSQEQQPNRISDSEQQAARSTGTSNASLLAGHSGSFHARLLSGLSTGQAATAEAPAAFMLLGLALGYGSGLAYHHYCRSRAQQEFIKGWRRSTSSA